MSAVISDQQSGPKVAEFFSPGPGERLRAARLSSGFDIGKIASELHLTNAVVEQLEADNYEGIGARVFVRGYLRNYARVVGMPADSVLHQFDEKWPDDQARQSMLRESPRLPADGSPSRGWAGAITWVLVIGLIALFLVWWQGHLDALVPEPIRTVDDATGPAQSETKAAQIAQTDDASHIADSPVYGDGSLALPVLGTGSNPKAAGQTEAAADPVPEPEPEPVTPVALPTLTPGNPPAAEAVARNANSAASLAAVVAQARASGSTTGGLTEPAPAADGGAPVIDATTGIVMTFSAPCWVDVRDSSREFKLFGEMPTGSRKVLGGEPPYKLVIGNARAVTIEVNGKPFDIAPYAKGNVARFTLNP